MIILFTLFSTFILPTIHCNYLPIKHYFGYPSPFPYMIPSYGVVPIVVKKTENIYPNLRSRVDDSSNDPNFASYPVIASENEDTSEVFANVDEIQGKKIEPKIIKGNLFKKFDLSSLKEDPLVVKCREKFGGTLIDEECYKYYNARITFAAARKFCQDRGGELWTPAPNDAFLYYKLGLLMPEYASSLFDDLFIGATVDGTGTKVTTVTGEDITNTLLINISDEVIGYDANECMVLSWYFGSLVTYGQPCTEDDQFICEFPLNDTTMTKAGLLLDKLSHLKNKLNVLSG